MTTHPFFTVLIPTMNRPDLLCSAIESVMLQTYKNYELIVSDNSSDAKFKKQNFEVLKRQKKHSSIRYISPPHWMNMPDHWEFASKQASGRYVIILTDRHVMRPSALEFLNKQIKELKDDAMVITWHSGSGFGIGMAGIHYYESFFTGKREVLNAKEEMREFAKCTNWIASPIWQNRLPRMLNSCYCSDLANQIREKHGRLFMPINPDYTCAYLLLSYVKRFTYIDKPLFIHHGNKSNGRKSFLIGIDEYLASLGELDSYSITPVTLNSVTDSIVRDLLMVKKITDGQLSSVDFDIVGYHMYNYRELMHIQRLGSLRDTNYLYKKWWSITNQLESEQQALIVNHVKELERQRAPFTYLRRLVRRFGLVEFYQFILGWGIYIKFRLSGQPVYKNVIEAAIDTDSILLDM